MSITLDKTPEVKTEALGATGLEALEMGAARVQVDDKKRGIIEMPINSNEKIIIENSKKVDNILRYIDDKKIIKIIYIKNKLINLIIKK